MIGIKDKSKQVLFQLLGRLQIERSLIYIENLYIFYAFKINNSNEYQRQMFKFDHEINEKSKESKSLKRIIPLKVLRVDNISLIKMTTKVAIEPSKVRQKYWLHEIWKYIKWLTFSLFGDNYANMKLQKHRVLPVFCCCCCCFSFLLVSSEIDKRYLNIQKKIHIKQHIRVSKHKT